MKLNEAMIWWNDDKDHADDIGKPRIRVLPRMSDQEAQQYYYLSNSVGACFGGWESADPVSLAANVLSIFHRMVAVDGVPAAEAHAELMKIDEYRDWVEKEEGPFWENHWRWERG